MRTITKVTFAVFISIFTIACSGGDVNEQPTPVKPITPKKMNYVEGFPASRIALIEEETRLVLTSIERFDPLERGRFKSFVSRSKTWAPGQKVTVAFNGGNKQLRDRIVSATKPWTEVGNIVLDFGDSGQEGKHREWSFADTTYRADIRIAFESQGKNAGLWSALGRESIRDICEDNPLAKSCYFPFEASMNFGGFTFDLPGDWRAIVLHEFGHALGFMHEHQSETSSCEAEYRWEDDPGYVLTKDSDHYVITDPQGRRPGIYTVLGSKDNYWSKNDTDFNLRKYPNAGDWISSAFDKLSIMKYDFDDWMFKDPGVSRKSGCLSPTNSGLSVQDSTAIAQFYPKSTEESTKVLDERIQDARDVLKIQKLPGDLAVEIKRSSKQLTEAVSK